LSEAKPIVDREAVGWVSLTLNPSYELAAT
jgi:hypothetical protein